MFKKKKSIQKENSSRSFQTAKKTDLSVFPYLKPGDIAFRLGNPKIAKKMNSPVTHCGIHVEDGVLHDIVGFGQRFVDINTFLGEGISNIPRVIRFEGKHHEQIVSKLIDNIKKEKFWIPTDPVPWNIISTAERYVTASCIHYCYYQYLYAIENLFEHTEIKEEYEFQDKTKHLISPDLFHLKYYYLYLVKLHTKSGQVDETVFLNRWEDEKRGLNIFRTIHLNAYSFNSFIKSDFFTEKPVT